MKHHARLRQVESPEEQQIKKEEFSKYIRDLTVEELKELTKSLIFLSAFAINTPYSEYHWQTRLCYTELKDRTGNSNLYAELYIEETSLHTKSIF